MTALAAARRLMRRYAPHARLALLKRPPEYRGRMIQTEAGAIIIKWSPKCPLMILLHELGHLRLRHYGDRLFARAMKSQAEMAWQEVRAWLWAEEAAYRHHLPFSHELADTCFASYTRQIRVAWRHRRAAN